MKGWALQHVILAFIKKWDWPWMYQICYFEGLVKKKNVTAMINENNVFVFFPVFFKITNKAVLVELPIVRFHDITQLGYGRGWWERSNMRISPPQHFTLTFPLSHRKQHTIYISSNNLEHIFGFINTAQSGLSLFEAEPATDYLVREPRLSSCSMREL